jgi:hypothetical protein
MCTALANGFNPTDMGSCPDTRVLFEAITLSNFFTDVIVLCLPIITVWNLKLNVRHRLIVGGIFLTGGLACIAAIQRIISQTVVNPAEFIGKFPPPCDFCCGGLYQL